MSESKSAREALSASASTVATTTTTEKEKEKEKKRKPSSELLAKRAQRHRIEEPSSSSSSSSPPSPPVPAVAGVSESKSIGMYVLSVTCCLFFFCLILNGILIRCSFCGVHLTKGEEEEPFQCISCDKVLCWTCHHEWSSSDISTIPNELDHNEPGFDICSYRCRRGRHQWKDSPEEGGV